MIPVGIKSHGLKKELMVIIAVSCKPLCTISIILNSSSLSTVPMSFENLIKKGFIITKSSKPTKSIQFVEITDLKSFQLDSHERTTLSSA